MSEQLPKIVIERSQPAQGQPVRVEFFGDEGKFGEALFSFRDWIQFQKTIKEGLDSLRLKKQKQMEIVIRGMGVQAKESPATSRPELEIGQVEKPQVTEEDCRRALAELQKETEEM